MDHSKNLEEKLREAACTGDSEAVKILLGKGVNIDAKHDVNGWTALHWAVKRSNADIVRLLLTSGANKAVTNANGDMPSAFATDKTIAELLQTEIITSHTENNLPITPNYIKNPQFGYKVDLVDVGPRSSTIQQFNPSSLSAVRPMNKTTTVKVEELVVKVRVANICDTDFVEVELPMNDLTYSRMLRTCCEELGVNAQHVLRVRKLPDTIVRKDKDVQRFQNFQELELVVANRDKGSLSWNGITRSAANGAIKPGVFGNQTILY